MISFNKDSAWDLKPMAISSVHPNLNRILLADEQIVAAFKTVRDQIVFTNERIVL